MRRGASPPLWRRRYSWPGLVAAARRLAQVAAGRTGQRRARPGPQVGAGRWAAGPWLWRRVAAVGTGREGAYLRPRVFRAEIAPTPTTSSPRRATVVQRDGVGLGAAPVRARGPTSRWLDIAARRLVGTRGRGQARPEAGLRTAPRARRLPDPATASFVAMMRRAAAPQVRGAARPPVPRVGQLIERRSWSAALAAVPAARQASRGARRLPEVRRALGAGSETRWSGLVTKADLVEVVERVKREVKEEIGREAYLDSAR